MQKNREEKSNSKIKARVLIIDDAPDILRVLEVLLSEQYEVLLALDGVIGFTYALKYLPDLILLDIMMPKMSGYQFCDLIKKTPALQKIPIIFLSAKGTMGDIDYGLQKGAVAYLPKPLENAKVLETVKSVLKANPVVKKNRPDYEQMVLDISPEKNADIIRWEI